MIFSGSITCGLDVVIMRNNELGSERCQIRVRIVVAWMPRFQIISLLLRANKRIYDTVYDEPPVLGFSL